MSERAKIKTTIKQAVEYWSNLIDECDLSVDWAEADTHCWRCGCEKNLQRCHIIPHALGGADSPENIVLLCGRCHAEGPNVRDTSIMWDWIKAYKVPFYETFWIIQGQREYEFIYKKSVLQEIKDISAKANIEDKNVIIDKFKSLYDGAMKNASIHYGQPYFNTATIAGIYRMIFKQLCKEFTISLD